MPLPRLLPVLASVLTATGTVLAVAGCSHIAPLGPGPAPVSLPPAHDLGSPITMQIMRSQPPTPAGGCPVTSVLLVGLEPDVPRAAIASHQPLPAGSGSTATATPAAPATPPPGVACYLPVGRPVTITSAAVSSVTTDSEQPGPSWYGFVVAFPAAQIATLTALIRRAYDLGDSLGLSVAGKLWQAPQPRSRFNALRAEKVILFSKAQARQLHRLLVPAA
jgi:hypothetical protein